MKRVRGWLRSNVWALVVIVVCGAASVWYSFAFDWARFQNGNPTQIIDVPSGKQATYAGGTFSLAGLTILKGDSPEGRTYDVLEGTDVVVVDVRVTPRENGDPDDYISCDVRLDAPSPEGVREWWPHSNPTTYSDGDPDVFGCDFSSGSTFTYRQFFQVPTGAADDPTVVIFALGELPLALHLH